MREARSAGPPPSGRVPRGERAIARVDAICGAAAALLVADDRIVMSELARRAGISIGSLYQYFPSEAAVVAQLASRHLRSGHEALARRLSEPGAAEDPPRSLDVALRDYLGVARDRQAVAVMRAIRADPALAALDREDTRRNARAAARALGRPDLAAVLAFVIDLAGATILLLSARPTAQRAALTETFVAMARAALSG